MKTGDFSNFVNSNGVLIPIYDPQTGQQFQCNGKLNVICPNRIDPSVEVAVCSTFPTPTRRERTTACRTT